jgi:hypothetical protein
MKLHILLLGLVCFSALAVAQQEPLSFVAVGRGFAISQQNDNPEVFWKTETNTNVALGYRILPGVFLEGYFDHTPVSFRDYGGQNEAKSIYSLNSILLGARFPIIIPGKILSPYFEGLIGATWIKSSRDTITGETKMNGSSTYYTVHGSTFTVLGAVGVDLGIYKGFFAFGEVRASEGIDTRIYDIIIMYRVGVGFKLY